MEEPGSFQEFEALCEYGILGSVSPDDVARMHAVVDNLAALYQRRLSVHAEAWKSPARKRVFPSIENGLPAADRV